MKCTLAIALLLSLTTTTARASAQGEAAALADDAYPWTTAQIIPAEARHPYPPVFEVGKVQEGYRRELSWEVCRSFDEWAFSRRLFDQGVSAFVRDHLAWAVEGCREFGFNIKLEG